MHENILITNFFHFSSTRLVAKANTHVIEETDANDEVKKNDISKV